MTRPHRVRALVAVLALTAALAGCGTDGSRDPGAGPSSGSGSPGDSASTGPTDDPGGSSSGAVPALPDPGTAGSPAAVRARTALLDWQDEGGDPAATLVTGSHLRVVLSRDGRTADMTYRNDRLTLGPPQGLRFTDALTDGRFVALIATDRAEERPDAAVVVRLNGMEKSGRDASSDPGTVPGGPWALAEGRLYHATVGPRRAPCLAEVDLPTGAGQTTYCAQPRTGFNQIRPTPEGLGLMTFGAPRQGVSCRTLVTVGEAALERFPGVRRCAGWEGVPMPDGAVWTEIVDEQRIEQAEVRARVGEGYYDLGPAVTGSLVRCGGAAYFTRDPQREGDPARLLRWDGRSLTIVYEGGAGGPAALSAPRCGGHRVTVSLLAESGDEQASAPAG